MTDEQRGSKLILPPEFPVEETDLMELIASAKEGLDYVTMALARRDIVEFEMSLAVVASTLPMLHAGGAYFIRRRNEAPEREDTVGG